MAIYAHPLFLLVSECKVRAFYGFCGDIEGRGPAMESLGTEVRGEGEHRLHYRK